jgi:hypothetical protein
MASMCASGANRKRTFTEKLPLGVIPSVAVLQAKRGISRVRLAQGRVVDPLRRHCEIGRSLA